MHYFCTQCSYSYDEGKGDEQEGILPGTLIENIHTCPQCGEYESFQGVQEEVNYLDYSSLPLGEEAITSLEAEHMIQWEDVGDDTILVKVGQPDFHATGEDHRITTLELYDEYGDRADVKFFASEEIPETEFDTSGMDKFEIRAKCSLHGTWGIKCEK
ncbi:rubredoxin [Candidatus Gracilibacteria bacterium]|nr:rubredoxin [Candidatus Gracilibacteria bacterium]